MDSRSRSLNSAQTPVLSLHILRDKKQRLSKRCFFFRIEWILAIVRNSSDAGHRNTVGHW
jgi:hypothetical protein